MKSRLQSIQQALARLPWRARLASLGGGVVVVLIAASILQGGDDKTAPLPPTELGQLGKLAYIVEGDIWIKELPNGQPVQLTDEGIYSFPRWSHSGEWLVAGDTWAPRTGTILAADGSQQRATAGCGSWSPTEDILACSTNYYLRLETPDGTVIRNLDLRTVLEGFPEFIDMITDCYAWSHDGRYIACNVNAALGRAVEIGFVPTGEYSGIWVVKADGSDAWEVYGNDPTAEGGTYVSNSGWTHDDRNILFVPYTTDQAWQDGVLLYSVPVSGSGTPSPVGGTILPRGELQGNNRALDGRIAPTIGEGRQTWTNKRIGLVDQSSGSLTLLTDSDQAAFSPDWSSDYERLAYVSAPDVGEIEGLDTLLTPEAGATPSTTDEARQAMAHRRIWMMDSDGSNKRELTNDDRYRDERPLWSKDDSHILFARMDADARQSLWLLPLDSNPPFQVGDISPCNPDERVCISTPSLASHTGPSWFGYYGYIAWNALYSWWQPD